MFFKIRKKAATLEKQIVQQKMHDIAEKMIIEHLRKYPRFFTSTLEAHVTAEKEMINQRREKTKISHQIKDLQVFYLLIDEFSAEQAEKKLSL